uniref:Uncharacterized protein LOC109674866 n=1 Tax=Castor canadensis TaxID=51338 RepID=A0A8B7TI63_CASCN
ENSSRQLLLSPLPSAPQASERARHPRRKERLRQARGEPGVALQQAQRPPSERAAQRPSSHCPLRLVRAALRTFLRTHPARTRREPRGVSKRSAHSLHPGEGRLASPTRTPRPRLGSSGASSRLSSAPPTAGLAAASGPLPPPGAPRLPSPTPAPRPGLSTTSLRSWRPHVFKGQPARIDVVSRSDLQARPQLPRQHQTGPSRTRSHCAPRRRGVWPQPLSRPRRPGPLAAPAQSAARAAVSPPTRDKGGCSDFGYWGCRRPAGEVSAALALLAAAAAGTLAAASCLPSLPRTTPELKTLAPDLLSGAPRSCPRPGWVSWLGLRPPGVNVQPGVCGDRIRGAAAGRDSKMKLWDVVAVCLVLLHTASAFPLPAGKRLPEAPAEDRSLGRSRAPFALSRDCKNRSLPAGGRWRPPGTPTRRTHAPQAGPGRLCASGPARRKAAGR